jgi:hypothetical protein
VNYVTVQGAAAGSAPVIGTAGSDTNINLVLTPKGTGNVGIGTTSPFATLQVTGATSFGTNSSYAIVASSSANTARNVAIGYDNAFNAGVIQSAQNGFGPENLSLNPGGGNVGIGTTSPSEKLNVNGGNIGVTSGQIYSAVQTSSVVSPLTFDTNSGNTMVWTTNTASPTININNMKAGGSYSLVIAGTGTGSATINCYSDAGVTSLPGSFVPANGSRVAGTLNKTVYTLLSDGTNCLITWITGF